MRHRDIASPIILRAHQWRAIPTGSDDAILSDHVALLTASGQATPLTALPQQLREWSEIAIKTGFSVRVSRSRFQITGEPFGQEWPSQPYLIADDFVERACKQWQVAAELIGRGITIGAFEPIDLDHPFDREVL